MSDPLGLISSASASPLRGPGAVGMPGAGTSRTAAPQGPAFKDVLMQQIDEVNKMQAEAEQAVEDLQTGRRDDMAQVLMAQQKADLAFQMLLQVRNKLMDAYQEVKDIRV